MNFGQSRNFALDPSGNIYVWDGFTYNVRKFSVATSALIYPTTTNVGTADSSDDPMSVLLSNAGNANLVVSPPAVGTNPALSPAWSIDPTSTCSQIDKNAAAYSVLVGATCNFKVDFTPTAAGVNTGTLVFSDNTSNVATSTQSVNLSGTGTGVATVVTISLSPTSYNFADTPVKSPSATTSITVSNTGTATANITAITLTGTGAANFSRTSSCGMTLAAGSTCTVMVTFTPTAAQSFSASLSVASDDPNSPATTALTGKGISANPTIPATNVGSVSQPVTVTIQLKQDSIISGITIPTSLGGKADFSIVSISGCVIDGTTVNTAGTVCSVTITFNPAYPGPRSAPLKLAAGAASVNVPLNGLGLGPQVALSPGIVSIIGGGCTTNCAAQNAEGVPASSETMSLISDLKVNNAGDIYFIGGPGVRKIDAKTGIVNSVAGASSTTGNLATQTLLNGPVAIALDSASNFYIADYSTYFNYSLVRKVDGATGVITTIGGEGSGNNGVPIPAPGVMATQTVLPNLNDIATDAAGNIYIASYSQILRIDAVTDILTYIAGTPNVRSYTGDGGLATAATLNLPTGLVFDPAGNLYFSDSANYVVRRIDAATGKISTFAGNPNAKENEGYVGPATGTDIIPGRLDSDSAGNIYIGDQVDRFVGIRRVDAATNIMTTIAGHDRTVVDGDVGRATDDFQPQVSGFALDSLGNLIAYTQALASEIVKIDVTTTRINFPYTLNTVQGAVPPVGSAYPNANAEIINVTNIGNAPLDISAPAIGANPFVTGAAYTLDDPATSGCAALSTTSADASLAPGTSCLLAVDFTPTATKNPAQIVLTDNALNVLATQTVTLSGEGQASTSGSFSVSATSLNFPQTAIGATSASQTATLSNTTAQPIHLSTATLTDATDFTQSDNCNGLLAAGGTCTVTFDFKPQSAVSDTSTYSIHDLNNAATSVSVTLSGTGINVTPTANAGGPYTGTTGTAISFNANGSSDPQNKTLTYAWDFGDNTTGTGATPTHTYTSAGTFNVKLTVTDSDNNTASASSTATVTTTYSAALTPTSYNFGSVNEGSTATQIFTLTNSSRASMNIASVQLAAEATNSYTSSTTCGTALAANTACTVTVTFKPTTAGAIATTLTIKDDAGTQTASITGTGVALTATLTPATFDFDKVTVGSTATQIFTLTNTSTTSISVNTVLLNAEATNSFSSTTTCGTSLAAGKNCTVTVTFKPTSATAISTMLTVGDSAGVQNAAITGTGTPAPSPVATLTPSLTFTSNLGSTAAAQTATLSNTGNATLTITSIALTGTNPGLFAKSTTCGTTLAAGANCAIALTFSPGATGNFTASLVVTDNSGSAGTTTSTQSTLLSGTGTAPQASLTPATAAFGLIVVGATNPTQTFKLSNAGTGALAISSIALTGTNASAFSLGTNTCGTSLAAGANCTVAVNFLTTTVGIDTASLTIVDAVGTQTSTLTGTILAFPLDFTLKSDTVNSPTAVFNLSLQSSATSQAFPYPITLTTDISMNNYLHVVFTPAIVTPGSGIATSVLKVTISPNGMSMLGPHPARKPSFPLPLSCSLFGLALLARKRLRRGLLSLLLCCALLAGSVGLTGCGIDGPVTGTITATGHGITHTLAISMTDPYDLP